MSEKPLSALAMISIIKKFIHNMGSFDGKVIKQFISQTYRLDFVYKK